MPEGAARQGYHWKETLGSRLRLIARTSRPPPDRTRRRYALLVDSLDDEHEQSVVQGTLTAARELDARLVVIPGGPIDAPDERTRAGNFAFDLIGEDNTLGK